MTALRRAGATILASCARVIWRTTRCSTARRAAAMRATRSRSGSAPRRGSSFNCRSTPIQHGDRRRTSSRCRRDGLARHRFAYRCQRGGRLVDGRLPATPASDPSCTTTPWKAATAKTRTTPLPRPYLLVMTARVCISAERIARRPAQEVHSCPGQGGQRAPFPQPARLRRAACRGTKIIEDFVSDACNADATGRRIVPMGRSELLLRVRRAFAVSESAVSRCETVSRCSASVQRRA